MFIPAYRDGGGPIVPHPHYIAAATAVSKGAVVKITAGTGVATASGTDFIFAVLGVAAEGHAGSGSGRDVGTEILVYDDPDIVFYNIPKTLSTTTGGSATTWVDSSLTAANDVFNGGHIVIVTTNSISGFAVNDILNITDFVNSTGTCTVTGAGGTIASGMTGYIYPGTLAEGCSTFDLNSTDLNIDLDTAGGNAMVIKEVVWDAAKKEARVYVKFLKHAFGS